jgi:hypothetical protein
MNTYLIVFFILIVLAIVLYIVILDYLFLHSKFDQPMMKGGAASDDPISTAFIYGLDFLRHFWLTR